jgi:hypothetical protein
MSHLYEHRNFMIFNMNEVDTIDFNEILETSQDTLRKSVDGTKSFVKWDSETVPPSVDILTTKEGPYNYDEILEILAGPEWTDPNPIGV